MSKLVLVLNCGSSSLKFAVIDATTGDDLLSGLAECFNLDDARIKVGPPQGITELDADQAVPAPGELRVTKKDVFVGTAGKPVRLGTVQPPGKKPMAAADWARGARLTDGQVLR